MHLASFPLVLPRALRVAALAPQGSHPPPPPMSRKNPSSKGMSLSSLMALTTAASSMGGTSPAKSDASTCSTNSERDRRQRNREVSKEQLRSTAVWQVCIHGCAYLYCTCCCIMPLNKESVYHQRFPPFIYLPYLYLVALVPWP